MDEKTHKNANELNNLKPTFRLPDDAGLRKTYPLEEFMNEKFKGNKPIIDGLISTSEMIGFVAKSKLGKSLVTSKMLIDACKGKEIFGYFQTNPNFEIKALLLDLEVSFGALQARLESFIDDGDMSKLKIDVCKSPFDFSRYDEIQALRDLIKAKGYNLIVIDPLYRSYSGNEMKQKDIKGFLPSLQTEITQLGCSCILVCHEGKSIEGDARSNHIGHKIRGSSAISDVLDGTIRLHKVNETEYTLSGQFRNRESFESISLLKDGMEFRYNGTQLPPAKQVAKTVIELIKQSQNQSMVFDEIWKAYQATPSKLIFSKSSMRNYLKASPHINVSKIGGVNQYEISE